MDNSLDIESVHKGDWLSWSSVWELVPLQAAVYYKRFSRFFVGEADDLAQAAYLALLELQKRNGVSDRVRELPILETLHKAMLSEIKGNRRESGRLSEQLPATDHQLNPKQIEMLATWRQLASQAARSPAWEMIWLRNCLQWTDQQIADYISKKLHVYYNTSDVCKIIKYGTIRLRKRMPDFANVDIRLLHFYH